MAVTFQMMIKMQAVHSIDRYLKKMTKEEACNELASVPILKRNETWMKFAEEYGVVSFVSYDDTLAYHGKTAAQDGHFPPPYRRNWLSALWFKWRYRKYIKNKLKRGRL